MRKDGLESFKMTRKKKFFSVLLALMVLFLVHEMIMTRFTNEKPYGLKQILPEDDYLISRRNSTSNKTILFHSHFFGDPWSSMFGRRDLLENCSVRSCTFAFNSSHPEDADAIIFHDFDFNLKDAPLVRKPHQRYIWLNMEAPKQPAGWKWRDRNGFFNWTFTYNRQSDLLLIYGGLRSLRGDPDPPRPGLLDTTGQTYREYMTALDGYQSLEDEPKHNWTSFLKRPNLVAWMVSHCNTNSGREFYVKELQKYVHVDVYGKCGNLRCGKRHTDLHCYSHVLRPTYKFYLSFENNMCVDYITEKVWRPLRYGLVPIVYGGSNYDNFLPPHSYIDATRLTPLELAKTLKRVASSPEEYGKYHLWRRYWKVTEHLSWCELCQKLHDDATVSVQQDLGSWWNGVNQCFTHYPAHKFERGLEPGQVTFLEKLKAASNIFGNLIVKVIKRG